MPNDREQDLGCFQLDVDHFQSNKRSLTIPCLYSLKQANA